MSEENKVDKVTTNYLNMKKAGMPTVIIIVMTILSSPGLWTYFFDKSSDAALDKAVVAEEKVEVAYEVLVAEVNEIRRDNEQLALKLQNMTDITLMLLRRGIGSEGSSSVVGVPSVRRPRPSSNARQPSGAPEVQMNDAIPDDVVEEMYIQQQAPVIEQREALPELDDAVKSKK